MTSKNFFTFIAFGTFLLIITGATFVQVAVADIIFPIAELGNCGTKAECKTYCDQPAHINACADFALQHGLMNQDEAAKAKKFAQTLDKETPGGCQNKEECEAFCNDVNHMNECISFAEQHGLIPKEELQKAKAVQKALAQGAKMPGGCANKTQCEAYCQDPSRMEECLAFAEAAGFVSPEEAAKAKKVMPLMQAGQAPGGCTSKESCDAYCNQEEHAIECVNFAEKAGFISPEEATRARKTGGKGPGGCKGKAECENYCDSDEHFEVCLEFAHEHGFMEEEEYQRAKKMGPMIRRGGPGGCKGKEECSAYCEKPEHMDECIDFSLRTGMITPEEAEKRKRGGPGGCRTKEDCEAYCQNPGHSEECLEFAVKEGHMTPEEAEKMKNGGQKMYGPGGCRNQEECEAYCQDPAHTEECRKSNNDRDIKQMAPEELERMTQGKPRQTEPGPGGCQTPQECLIYCNDPAHFTECGQFNSGEKEYGPGEYTGNKIEPPKEGMIIDFEKREMIEAKKMEETTHPADKELWPSETEIMPEDRQLPINSGKEFYPPQNMPEYPMPNRPQQPDYITDPKNFQGEFMMGAPKDLPKDMLNKPDGYSKMPEGEVLPPPERYDLPPNSLEIFDKPNSMMPPSETPTPPNMFDVKEPPNIHENIYNEDIPLP